MVGQGNDVAPGVWLMCPWCFYPFEKKRHNQKFCSTPCRSLHFQAQDDRYNKPKYRHCFDRDCTNTFTPRDKDQRFCDETHRRLAMERHLEWLKMEEEYEEETMYHDSDDE